MFGRSFKLFNLFGFKVSIDLSWIIIAVLVSWSLAAGLFPYLYHGLSAIGRVGAEKTVYDRRTRGTRCLSSVRYVISDTCFSNSPGKNASWYRVMGVST